MMSAVFATVASYVVIAVLLLSLNLTSRWIWWIKAGAIGLTTAFFVGSYTSILSLLGWPSGQPIPDRFQLIWAKVVEPDRHSGEKGAIYLWLEALDGSNFPSGVPRAHQLPYTDRLARQVRAAQEQRQQGKEVAGTVERVEEGAEPSEVEMAGPEDKAGEQAGRMDTVPFAEDSLRIQFEDMPPPVLPDKGPL